MVQFNSVADGPCPHRGAVKCAGGRSFGIRDLRSGPDDAYDWVHNEAEIDGSRIVWARDMGAAKNQELIDYFKGRRVWMVDPAGEQPKLTEYPAQAHAAARSSGATY